MNLLPPSAPARGRRPAWRNATTFRSAVATAAARLQAERLLLQSRGFNIHVGGLGHGMVLLPNPLRPDIRGAFLLPLLGVPVSATTADQLAAQARTLIAAAPTGIQPAEWLLYDSRHVAAIRARLTLNRSALRAVLHSRNPDPRPELRRCPHCGPDAPAETVVHALAECPAYAPQRAMLK